MISDLVYINRDLYTSNQIRSRSTYLSSLDATSLYIRGFCHFINLLTDKADVYIKKKFLLRLTGFLSLLLLKVLESDISYNLTSGQFTKRLTTWIIHNLLCRNTASYIYTFKEVTYYKLIALLI